VCALNFASQLPQPNFIQPHICFLTLNSSPNPFISFWSLTNMKYLLHQYNPHSPTQVYNPPSNTSCPAIFEFSSMNRVRCISFWELSLPSFENPNTSVEFTSHHRPPLLPPLLGSKGLNWTWCPLFCEPSLASFRAQLLLQFFPPTKSTSLRGNVVILGGHDMLTQKLF